MSLVTPRSLWKAPSGSWYPLMDAEAAVYATVTKDDVQCGVQGNPCECVIAQAFRRATGSPDVLIGTSAAYVVMKKGDTLIAFRFKVPAATRKAIDVFDATGEFPDGALSLTPMPQSNRLESKRSRDKRLRERWATRGHTRSTQTARRAGRNAAPLAKTLVVKRHAGDYELLTRA